MNQSVQFISIRLQAMSRQVTNFNPFYLNDVRTCVVLSRHEYKFCSVDFFLLIIQTSIFVDLKRGCFC